MDGHPFNPAASHARANHLPPSFGDTDFTYPWKLPLNSISWCLHFHRLIEIMQSGYIEIFRMSRNLIQLLSSTLLFFSLLA